MENRKHRESLMWLVVCGGYTRIFDGPWRD